MISHKHVLPIFRYAEGSPLNAPTQLMGTAFYLGNNTIITAAHCLPEKTDPLVVGILDSNKTGMLLCPITEIERHSTQDIGLARFQAESNSASPLRWGKLPRMVELLADVYSVGYPHGYDPDPSGGRLTLRALKGHIVSRTYLKDNDVDVYELSFQAPLGISGAPLMAFDWVAGIMIGQSETSMEITTHTERSTDGFKTDTIVTNQMIHYGIAVTSDALTFESPLLGMPFWDYIDQNDLRHVGSWGSPHIIN